MPTCSALFAPQAGSPDRKNRFLSIVPARCSSPTAIRVTLTDLQNPVPPNAPQFPSPDFSTFEAGPTCTGDPTNPPPPPGVGNCARWVGPPSTFLEAQDSPGVGSFRGARLQCTAHYWNWSGENVIHIAGAEILPSSKYDVQLIDQACEVSVELNYSPALTIQTARHGDVASAFNPPSTTTQPDGLDVSGVVDKFKGLPGAMSKVDAQVQPNLPELNTDVDAMDIVAVVDAFKGLAYPLSGPCACPSTVTCGATPCTTSAQCAGDTCVRTCVGGVNDLLPCINNNHCLGGSCGVGFCRDKCGRCSP